MSIAIVKRRGSGYRRWGVVALGKNFQRRVSDDLTKGQAHSRGVWIAKVIELFKERERRMSSDGVVRVRAGKHHGIGKQCWDVGWGLGDGRTDACVRDSFDEAKCPSARARRQWNHRWIR